jgi:hypothetical protein
MRTVLVFLSLLGLLCVLPALSRGDPPQTQPASAQAELRRELRGLEEAYGPSHPKVLAVKARLAELEPGFKGHVLVLTGVEDTAVTLRDIRSLSYGGRHFVVGTEVQSNYNRGTFVGKRVWIPIDDVTKMVELGDPKPEPK